ncbi:hypothetical protein [Malacoplasma penetrans]|nr:hypothetical protein [Malacoplasma penetrans]
MEKKKPEKFVLTLEHVKQSIENLYKEEDFENIKMIIRELAKK